MKIIISIVALTTVGWSVMMSLIVVTAHRISGNTIDWVLQKIFNNENSIYLYMTIASYIVILISMLMATYKKPIDK